MIHTAGDSASACETACTDSDRQQQYLEKDNAPRPTIHVDADPSEQRDKANGQQERVSHVSLISGLQHDLILKHRESVYRSKQREGAQPAAKSFGVAILLSAINPKNLGLTIAAASSIAAASLSPGEEIGVFAIFLLIASLTVAGPVIYYALARERAQKRLNSLKEWMIDNNNAVMTVLLLVIGVKLIGDGIGILS